MSFVSDLSTKWRSWESASVDALPQLCATEAEDGGLTRAGGPIHDPGIRFKYMELARVYDLSAVDQRHFRNFQI